MRGAVPPLPVFMAWCSAKKKAQGQFYFTLLCFTLLYFTLLLYTDWATGWTTGIPLLSGARKGGFLFTVAYRRVLVPT